MSQPKNNQSVDPLAELAKVARFDLGPDTNVTANVLRQIRVKNTIIAEKPLIWMAFATTAAALAIAIVSVPVFMTLIDPLNALFQSTPASLL